MEHNANIGGAPPMRGDWVGLEVRALTAAEAQAGVEALAGIMMDCVAGGAGVSFMAPLERGRAEAFWRGVADGVAAGNRVLLAAVQGGALVGTAQVVPAKAENQPHRADVEKVLVHRDARGRGVGAALLRAVEDAARAMGRTLLVLDTTTGSDAERMYARAGWVRVGEIPGFALLPDGRPWGTTLFYKTV